MSKSIFIGKRSSLFSHDKPYDRVHSKLSYIGVKHSDESYEVLLNQTRPVKVVTIINKANPKLVVRERNIPLERWHGIVARSKRKGLEYNLTIDDIHALINLPCEYCGDSQKLSEIDRKDSSKGYTKDNVAPACRRCNMIKNNVVTYEEMLKIVEILGWRQ